MVRLNSAARALAALMLLLSMTVVLRSTVSAQDLATPVTSSLDTISISFFDCTTDPLNVDPSASPDCSAASGVDAAVTIDGVASGTITSDGSGLATFQAPDGSAVVVAEDQSTITSGYSPYGDGVVSFTAADGLTRTFVHLPSADLGRVQIVSGTCPTSGESRTEFRVVEPGLHTDSAVSCEATGSVPFLITGGGLGAGLAVATDGDGNWRGFLPAGDYTIAAADSTTADFTAYSEDIVVVVAIDYVAQPTGTLTIARWECSSDQNAPVTIDVATDPPSDPADCTASNGDVSLAEVGSSADPAQLSLGETGSLSLDLKPGSYVLTDNTSGETASLEIGTGQTLYATISGGPAASGSGGDGNGTDGNGSGGNSSGGGDGATDSGNGSTDSGNGTDTSGDPSSSDGNGGVTSLPDTGVYQPRSGGSLPLGGAAGLLALSLAAAYLHRRKVIGKS